ncbi:serine hydrolase [Pseudonocardia sp. MH-G8]|uniref:serine hydrolase domain-containing protein n=1 Tax=Pseudonocardia sp. MH-G8 TaxID=1854588 RepID=UPI000BA0EEAB|nr:serine hydrolase domain-containing protein [Pseudonocardia sp. MH-G8]OZM83562.1 D-alanyl-D-alanine carboxypeptidase [Pseudonocardia sp. MH-G8]
MSCPTDHRTCRARRLLTAVTAAGAVLAASCAAQAPAPADPAPSVPAYGARLQPQLEQLARDLLVTGAAVQVRSAELGDWTTTMGTRTFRGSEPVQVGDHVRIGSVTKTWTGTVVLQLVDEGRLRLDDPVATYRPDVPNGPNITIEQLLTMRSGLGNYTTSLEINERMDADPGAVFDPEELIAIGLAEPPAFPPGEGYSYSNTNTVLLGRIVEQLTGAPLEAEIERRILAPLGLGASSFPARTSSALPEPRANGYTYGTNVETVDSNVLPPEKQAAARAGTLAPLDVTTSNPSWAWSAGAGISTSEDLVAYVQALVGGGLLSEATQQARIDSVRPIDPADPQGVGYGLALARFGPYYGHTGELPGYNTFAGHDPERGNTVVVWASLAPSPDGRAPAVEMARAIIGELSGSGG